ncbi:MULTISPECIES: hypothetical protein [unclassified Tenacibaculum]|uniref:hypothetical protein n=1 Tax=unclassified Tenacibaculum TaxID=2635139 RepID=UPI001F354C13|nr:MULTISPECIES: hypothetical protein [unclassified Tenacibaculum]MCF2874051.1 hypothetical protein [Tenacibaculum sp. Cn5-1]MCF2934633.1 hypothetical protein [Tenacibaculum sp. Cn5-34]MCG7510843.1 hypothetical protein [Tenacibaculum sp. Cn5-46]
MINPNDIVTYTDPVSKQTKKVTVLSINEVTAHVQVYGTFETFHCPTTDLTN